MLVFYLIVRALRAVSVEGEARTWLLPSLLSRLFIYKDSGWTRAHPLGGGGRREEKRSFISRQRHQTDTTEIINWLSLASFGGREERRGEDSMCRCWCEIRWCCLGRRVNTSPIKSDIRIRPGSHLAELTKNIFHHKTSSKYCCAQHFTARRSGEGRPHYIIWKILMSYF